MLQVGGTAVPWGSRLSCICQREPRARRRKAYQNIALAMAVVLQKCTFPQVRRRIKWFLAGAGWRLLHLPVP